MDKLRTGILRQVATQVMKAPTQTSTRLSASTSTHRRSSSTSSATPPARTEPKAGIPGAGRKAGTQPGAPEVVKKALGDVLKIDTQAPPAQRIAQFTELAERHHDSLTQCAGTPTPSGRDEFLASNMKTALIQLPGVLAKWVDGPSGQVFDSKAHELHLHDRRQVFQSLLDNPHKAAVYASVVHPSLRDKYGINMSAREMAALGVADKGPYLSESEFMMLCDYAHHESGTFNAKRALDVLAQQMGLAGRAFKAHMGPALALFGRALDKLDGHPGFSVTGTFTKGMQLGAYQEKGLTLLCQSGKPYPIEIATSAAKDRKDSYKNRDGYNAEVEFNGAQGVDISVLQSTATQGESEVLLRAGKPLLGAGTQQVSTPDPKRGGAETTYTRFVFEATPAPAGKGST